ncbi:hypothetical protein PHYPSEUDO_007890 [Phytophthora pseudosyringae]|uniref:CWH43-like N-terminal domain-containing protein n=1 Tax=Phytophthora pseudosyringae TaxID=221518 RepID=A0A8T1VFX9_9STRA|nr:hypothetical protein PHYPSEUDO_007890 [Phytophthora pseudosyringae]
MALLFTVGTRVAPVAATIVVIATLITCVSVAKAKDKYLGGLTWPYLSDTGRDMPGYAVFCAGLTTVGISLILTWFANYQFQSELLEKETDASAASINKYCKVVRVIGVLSAFGLPILAFFSTTSYPDVHQYAAYWFFVLEAVALILNTITSYKLSHRNKVSGYTTEPEASKSYTIVSPWTVYKSSTERTFYIQVVLTTLFLIAFLLYIPIGLALVGDFQRLTIKDCIAFDLGEKYCTETMRLSDTETKLWNYVNADEDTNSSLCVNAEPPRGFVHLATHTHTKFDHGEGAEELDETHAHVDAIDSEESGVQTE